MTLSKAADHRLVAALNRPVFRTPSGPAAVKEFIRLGDEQVRSRTQRQPTAQQLATELLSVAAHYSLVLHLDDRTATTSLLGLSKSIGFPDQPEIAYGLLQERINTGIYLPRHDGSYTVVRQMPRQRIAQDDLTAWATELDETRPEPAGMLIQPHPTKSGVITALIRNDAPDGSPLTLPVALLDFAYGTTASKQTEDACAVLFRNGFTVMPSGLDTYPPVNPDWTYHITKGSGAIRNRIRIFRPAAPHHLETAVYDRTILADADWFSVEAQSESIVLYAANFSFLDNGYAALPPEQVPDLIEERFRESGFLLGAIMRRSSSQGIARD